MFLHELYLTQKVSILNGKVRHVVCTKNYELVSALLSYRNNFSFIFICDAFYKTLDVENLTYSLIHL